MYCEHPLIHIINSDEKMDFGPLKGKRFVSSKWFLYHGYDINECARKRYINVYGCGKCTVCVNMRRYQWVRKMELEKQYWKNAYMITLTYNDENLPQDKQLNVKHLQRFFMRMRKNLKIQLNYFATGEYGTRTNRPHYHIILFTDYTLDLAPIKKTKNGMVYKSSTINKLWPFGFNSVVHCISNKAFTYCATYSNKAFLKQRLNLRKKNYEWERDALINTFSSSYQTYLKIDNALNEYLSKKVTPEFYVFSKKIPLGSRCDNLDRLPSSLVKLKYGQQVKSISGISNRFKSFQSDPRDVIRYSRANDKNKLRQDITTLFNHKDEIIALKEFEILDKNYKEFKNFIENNDLMLMSSSSATNEKSYNQLKINSSTF